MSPVLLRYHVAAVALSVALAGCAGSRPVSQPALTCGSAADATPGMSAVSATPPVPAAGDQVGIDDFAFAPATLTIRVGGTVTWTNHDEEPHTVAASDGSFHSPGMGTGASFSHTFTMPGTFGYLCSIHPMMHGTVVVTR
ncbi:amidase [Mycobacterium kansasii]|nr:amidase [Mycobacterium kansasii]